jgi:hypothetical protein
MSNEQQDLVNEAYENYSKEYEKDNSIGLLLPDGQTYIKLDRETFMSICKVSKIFSKKFGFMIEERELSEGERIELIRPFGMDALIPEARTIWMEENKIPTKLITVTYNDKTIEGYE